MTDLGYIQRLAQEILDHENAMSVGSVRLARAVMSMIPVVEEAMSAVDGDGCIPGSLCNAVVRFRRRCKEQP